MQIHEHCGGRNYVGMGNKVQEKCRIILHKIISISINISIIIYINYPSSCGDRFDCDVNLALIHYITEKCYVKIPSCKTHYTLFLK